MTKLGRPPAVLPEGLNPFTLPAWRVAEEAGVSAATVYKWRRENQHLRPPPVERVTRDRRGRPEKTRDEFAQWLDENHPGARDLCASNATHVAIGKAYGITGEAVRQWRVKLSRGACEGA